MATRGQIGAELCWFVFLGSRRACDRYPLFVVLAISRHAERYTAADVGPGRALGLSRRPDGSAHGTAATANDGRTTSAAPVDGLRYDGGVDVILCAALTRRRFRTPVLG